MKYKFSGTKTIYVETTIEAKSAEDALEVILKGEAEWDELNSLSSETDNIHLEYINDKKVAPSALFRRESKI